MWLKILTKSLPISSVDYVSHTVRRFAVSFEVKTNGTWICSASHFASDEDLLLDLFSCSAVQMENHSGQFLYLLFRHGRIHWTGLLPRGMNKDESKKIKVEIDYGKSFIKASSKATVDYCRLWITSFPFAELCLNVLRCDRIMLQAPEIPLNPQEVVHLERI